MERSRSEERLLGDRMVPVFVVLLIMVAFLVGTLWARVSVLETTFGPSKGGTAKGPVASSEVAAVPSKAPYVAPKISENTPTKGKKDAKVTVIEFADYQCPFCGGFSGLNKKIVDSMKQRNPTWEPLFPGLQAYIDNGQVLFAYKDFAFLGQESNISGEAAKCAQDQNKFWEYHDYLYGNQNGENQGAFSKDNLKKFAVTLGLNAAKFNDCLDSGKYTKAVLDETAEGRAAGVNGTPATFVNGRVISGAEPFSTIKQMIEEELKK